MKKIEKLEPFRKFCMNIYSVPTSYDDCLTYYEMLEWLCNYLEHTVIPTVNNNSETVEELQNLFTQLKAYVEHYFDNLDVQEEINNKLDEMTESGQLAEIIALYIQSSSVLGYKTKNDMKTATNLINGSICKTLSNDVIGDNGGRYYLIRTVTSSDVVDDENIIALEVSDTLIAQLINDDRLINLNENLTELTNNVGDLNELTTENKNNLVDSINEINTNSIKRIGAIIRPTSSGWVILNDSDHEKLNVDSISINNNRLVLTYNNNYNKVVSFSITPDETFAKYNITAGASVGLNSSNIDLFINVTANCYFRIMSGAVTLQSDFSNLVKSVYWDNNDKCIYVEFDDNLDFTYPTLWTSFFNPGSTTVDITNKLRTSYVENGKLKIEVYDSSNNKLTTIANYDRINVVYKICKKINPNELVSSPIAGSNFWINGMFK